MRASLGFAADLYAAAAARGKRNLSRHDSKVAETAVLRNSANVQSGTPRGRFQLRARLC
jgi:hypothetical protein